MNFRKYLYVIAGLSFITFSTGTAIAELGNGLPHGSKNGKFQVQVIAFENCPAGDFTDSERRMIAVEANYSLDGNLNSNQGGELASELVKNNTIELAPSMDDKFHVVDGNACGRGKSSAKLELPLCNENCDTYSLDVPEFTEYKVFVRLVGGQNTGIGATSCATQLVYDDVTDTEVEMIVCSTETVVELRTRGANSKPVYTDYSKELLTMVVDFGDGPERVGLFDPRLQYYFWQWNTQGRAHAQLVFIPVANIVE
jgi:hypothetical protein